ncbi:hypothetical protein [Fictibacillus sp. FJAT-27399]|uniref:hypothetical protein n=1 Tax=Fictibacillus sp. FJAT-27399 TaxID=1729689 RepID=UPI0012E39742|nr:hypothetical protein [Fictibacillus sp. FJAT-27399]
MNLTISHRQTSQHRRQTRCQAPKWRCQTPLRSWCLQKLRRLVSGTAPMRVLAKASSIGAWHCSDAGAWHYLFKHKLRSEVPGTLFTPIASAWHLVYFEDII